ncbi:MAG: heavy-metal-associated domain-containing protein [Ginsengibacter sp.]
MKFKTNIMCGSCIEKVTPQLNKVIGENNWKVDTTNPQKILSVTNDKLNSKEVISAVQAAGYKAEAI